jgi:hypothetical protein
MRCPSLTFVLSRCFCYPNGVMQFASADDFWAALGRLYDSTLEMKGRIDGIGDKVEKLAEATGHLVNATENLQKVAETHERRLDRAEITIEAILEDLRRSREKRAQ